MKTSRLVRVVIHIEDVPDNVTMTMVKDYVHTVVSEGLDNRPVDHWAQYLHHDLVKILKR